MSHSSTTTTDTVLAHAAEHASPRRPGRTSRNPVARPHVVAALAIGLTGAIAGFAGLASQSPSYRGVEGTGAASRLEIRTGADADLGALDQLWASSRSSHAADSKISSPRIRAGTEADVGALDLLRAR